MGKRRLTLAIPPYSITSQNVLRQSDSQLQFLNSSSSSSCDRVQSSAEFSENSRAMEDSKEINLEDWLNTDHFSALKPGRSSSIAFGLPKHSQPGTAIVKQRTNHQQLPLIAAVDSNSIMVGNLPIQFSWSSMSKEVPTQRSVDQILQNLCPPLKNSYFRQSLEKEEEKK